MTNKPEITKENGKPADGSAIKKLVITTLIFGAFLVLFDILLTSIRIKYSLYTSFETLALVIYFIILFLFLMSVLYKTVFTLKSSRIKIVLVLSLVFLASFFIAGRIVAIDRGYYFYKTLTKQTDSDIWLQDKQLAHRGKPGSSGNYYYYIGDSIQGSIPAYFDERGFRTVPADKRLTSQQKNLFLGCSCTFGDYVPAEYTYSYLTSAAMEHNYINGGTSAYGIGQMYQQANTLLKTDTFDYTFIQFSPWLADRAMKTEGPSYFGYRPFPYFYKNGSSYNLSYPLYMTCKPDTITWRNTKISYGDRLHFFFTRGVKMEIVDYMAHTIAEIKVKFGLAPAPATDKEELQEFFYNYIVDLTIKNHSKPVVLKLGYTEISERSTQLLKDLSRKATIIDLDSDLHMTDQEFYSKEYHIRHVTTTGDSIIYDAHPNTKAHKIIADKIINTLKQTN